MAEMLSAINESGLARVYADTLAEYEHTGILERDALRRHRQSRQRRYLAKLNLGNFIQNRAGRFSIAGIRLFETSRAQIRVHLEIWDSHTGTIAWQGNEELVYAREGVKERPVSFRYVAELAAERLIEKIGESGAETNSETSEAVASLEPTAEP